MVKDGGMQVAQLVVKCEKTVSNVKDPADAAIVMDVGSTAGNVDLSIHAGVETHVFSCQMELQRRCANARRVIRSARCEAIESSRRSGALTPHALT